MKKTVQFDRVIEEMEWLRMATLLDTVRLQELKRGEFDATDAHAEVLAQLDPRSTQKES